MPIVRRPTAPRRHDLVRHWAAGGRVQFGRSRACPLRALPAGVLTPAGGPPLAVTEVCHLLVSPQRRGNPALAAEFCAAIAEDELRVIEAMPHDYARMAELVTTYASPRLQVVDACVAALTKRLDLREVAAPDRRDLQIVAHGTCANEVGGPADVTGFRPQRLWIASANSTSASRRTLEFGFWLNDGTLLPQALRFLMGLWSHSEDFDPDADIPDLELVEPQYDDSAFAETAPCRTGRTTKTDWRNAECLIPAGCSPALTTEGPRDSPRGRCPCCQLSSVDSGMAGSVFTTPWALSSRTVIWLLLAGASRNSICPVPLLSYQVLTSSRLSILAE
jgi:predicted nucleic acid-binding protein